MKLLTNGSNPTAFEIDEEDYERVSKYRWYSTDRSYPWGKVGDQCIRLHQFILGPAPEGLEWDHKDRDKLNNKRSNLRAITHSKNLENRDPSFTQIPGICINSNKFAVYLPADMSPTNRKIYLGRTETVEAGIDLQFFHYILGLEEVEDGLLNRK